MFAGSAPPLWWYIHRKAGNQEKLAVRPRASSPHVKPAGKQTQPTKPSILQLPCPEFECARRKRILHGSTCHQPRPNRHPLIFFLATAVLERMSRHVTRVFMHETVSADVEDAGQGRRLEALGRRAAVDLKTCPDLFWCSLRPPLGVDEAAWNESRVWRLGQVALWFARSRSVL